MGDAGSGAGQQAVRLTAGHVVGAVVGGGNLAVARITGGGPVQSAPGGLRAVRMQLPVDESGLGAGGGGGDNVIAGHGGRICMQCRIETSALYYYRRIHSA